MTTARDMCIHAKCGASGEIVPTRQVRAFVTTTMRAFGTTRTRAFGTTEVRASGATEVKR